MCSEGPREQTTKQRIVLKLLRAVFTGRAQPAWVLRKLKFSDSVPSDDVTGRGREPIRNDGKNIFVEKHHL